MRQPNYREGLHFHLTIIKVSMYNERCITERCFVLKEEEFSLIFQVKNFLSRKNDIFA